MDTTDTPLSHYKKTLHSKRSFGKYPKSTDSPAYDASEEDNDPLTDDGASSAVSIPVTRHSTSNTITSSASRATASHSKPSSKAKHQLASSTLLSDDGVDSPTYDGDVESSTTAGHVDHHHTSKISPYLTTNHRQLSSTSTLNIPDTVPPIPHPSNQSSQSEVSSPRTAKADSHHPVFISPPVNVAAVPLRVPQEPEPVSASQAAFNPASLTAEDIRAFVQKALDGETWRTYKINKPPVDRPVRIYADGVYDLFHFGHALQLRQAKLSFPSVYLMVGVCSDELVKTHKSQSVMNHAERCESARHCRWVDEIIQDAPWVIDADFLDKWEIDYVAHDEDPYAAEGHDDVYGFVKRQGKFIPTRRTPGVSTSELLERIVSGYRKRDWDAKLVKMGHAELTAEGSDFDERSRPGSRFDSRGASPTPMRVQEE